MQVQGLYDPVTVIVEDGERLRHFLQARLLPLEHATQLLEPLTVRAARHARNDLHHRLHVISCQLGRVASVGRVAGSDTIDDPRCARRWAQDEEPHGYLIHQDDPDRDGLVEEEHDGLCECEGVVGCSWQWFLHGFQR